MKLGVHSDTIFFSAPTLSTKKILPSRRLSLVENISHVNVRVDIQCGKVGDQSR